MLKQTMFVLFLVLILQPQFTLAAPSCRQFFTSEATVQLIGDNKKLQKRYDEIDSESSMYTQMTFKKALKTYAQLIKNNEIDDVVRLVKTADFYYLAIERLELLWHRGISKTAEKKLNQQILAIDTLKAQRPEWASIAQSETSGVNVDQKIYRNFENLRGPKVDHKNIQSQDDVNSWTQASDYVLNVAAKKTKLTETQLMKLDYFVNQRRDISPWPGEMLMSNDINYMLTEKNGKQVLDPTNSFVPGATKRIMMEKFLKWVNKNLNTTHPVILAAQARQIVISIHPFFDGNGRFARLIADYILIRGGYPPAYIPKSTDDKNSSVALFPYKSFEDQIPAEDNYFIMAEGVLRAYQSTQGIVK